MSVLSWPIAYRRLAELLRDFYDQHKDLSGSILFSLAQNTPAADKLFPFLARFRDQKTDGMLDPVNVFASFNGQHLTDEQRIVRYNFWLDLLSFDTEKKK